MKRCKTETLHGRHPNRCTNVLQTERMGNPLVITRGCLATRTCINYIFYSMLDGAHMRLELLGLRLLMHALVRVQAQCRCGCFMRIKHH